jgi:hypothetical protein
MSVSNWMQRAGYFSSRCRSSSSKCLRGLSSELSIDASGKSAATAALSSGGAASFRADYVGVIKRSLRAAGGAVRRVDGRVGVWQWGRAVRVAARLAATTFRQAIVTAGIGALRVAVTEALDPLPVGT